MPEAASDFRDFGVLPTADLRPPAGPVRAYLSTGKLIGQYIFTGIVALIGLGAMLLFALVLPSPQNLLGGVAALLALSAVLYLATHNDYRSVELDGNVLRAKHAYTGRITERAIDEIDCLGTMVYQVRQTATVVMEKLLGRVKGIEIRFADGRTPMRILRADPAMANAQELIEAVVYRMSQVGPLVPEIVTFQGRPLVRRIFWQGHEPRPAPSKGVKAILLCGAMLALMFGAIFGFWGAAQRREYLIGSVPAQRIPLATLIKNGPGGNRHVEVTEFVAGGYVIEEENSAWREVNAALYPLAWAENRIPAVVTLHGIKNEAQLRQRLGQPILGICSSEPQTGWGGTIGEELVKANQGRALESRWSIEEMREPPTEASVTTLLNSASGCFAAVWLLAGVVLWRAAAGGS